MAYLNEKERQQLLDELTSPNMTFNKAKRKLRWLDSKTKLGVYRNVQNTGEWMTQYHLTGKGVVVTLIESNSTVEGDPNTRTPVGFELQRVIVEPTAENRT